MNKISQIRYLMTENSIPYEMQDKWVSPEVGLIHCPGKGYLLSWEDSTAGSWRRRWLEFPAQSKGEGESHREKKLAIGCLQYYTEYKENHAQKKTREDQAEKKHSY